MIETTCSHPPTWRVASHFRVVDALDEPYAATLCCDRPTCLANAAAWVFHMTNLEAHTTPVGIGSSLVYRDGLQRNTFLPSKGRVPLARNSDPASAKEGAKRAREKAGGHKRIILEWFAKHPEPLTAREVGETLYHKGFVTLHNIDTIRRRVQELAAEGRLVREDNGNDAATYRVEEE